MLLTHALSRAIAVAGIVAFTGTLAPAAYAQSSETFTIAVASNLKDVFRKILPLFEAQDRDVNVRVIYAQSKTLLKQIEEGAPVDVFVPSSYEELDQLEQKNLILQDTRQVYARTSLVLITNTAFPATIGSIRDLETLPVRYIAIGDPTTSPVGKDAVQFLKYRKLEPRLKSHYLLGEHSKAVLDLVSKGEAELGLVYRTDAIPVKRVRIIDTAPAESHRPITFGLAAPWTSENVFRSRDFIAFLLSDPIQEELKKYGFEQEVLDGGSTQRQEVKP
ncbi:MAG: molybdate ABC transporter substrate-binding protein [Nitrospira sp.]|nr:molybdate ABC transporter substrate-binding protein [Nitrospira sp.]